MVYYTNQSIGGGFIFVFIFTPKIGEDSNFEEYFFKWVAQPPTTSLHAQLFNVHVSLRDVLVILNHGNHEWFLKRSCLAT